MRPQDEKSKLRAYIQEHKQRRRWYKLTACLAAMAVLVTAGAMVLPAITLENSPEMLECQLDLHTHTDDCYDQAGNLICGQADFVVHTHTDKTTPRLIQFHTLKNAVNPPFLGGFFISNTVVWHRQNGNLTRAIHAFWQYSVTIEKLSLQSRAIVKMCYGFFLESYQHTGTSVLESRG